MLKHIALVGVSALVLASTGCGSGVACRRVKMGETVHYFAVGDGQECGYYDHDTNDTWFAKRSGFYFRYANFASSNEARAWVEQECRP